MTGPFEPPSGGSGQPNGDRRELPPELNPRRPASRTRQPRQRPAGGGRRWSRKRIAAVIAGGLAIVLVGTTAFGAATFAYVTGHIKQIDPFCHSCKRPGGGAMGDLNILIVGSDSRAGLTKAQEKQLHVGSDVGQRSDTMILLHIPKGGGKAILVNLPRDSYVTIPAHESDGHLVPAQKNKINAAYSEGGAALTIQTVEDNTGVRIDHYIEI